MSLFAMFHKARLMDEQGDGGDGAAAAEPAAAPASVKVDASTAEAPRQEPAQGSDADVLAAAGYAFAEDDPGLNYATKFLATNGFNADNPAVAAAFDGDFSLIKAELAQKGIAGWEQALGLAEQSYDRHVKAGEATAKEVGGIVTKVAEEAGVDWEQAITHVGKTATAEEKTAINTLLGNPKTAHIAAQFITGAFRNSGEVEFDPQASATQNGDNGKPSAGGKLTRVEYTGEMKKLRDALGDGYLDSPQAQVLYSRLVR